MIRVEGLTKTWRDDAASHQVLRGVDFAVAEGEFVAVVGASGSGKTTLLNVVGGLDRDYGGSARVLGRDLATLPEKELALYRNRDVGFVFQSFNLLAPLTALQNVLLPAHFAAGDEREDERRALEALARMGLAGKEHRLPAQLSGGERQRVALARAIFRRPRLLLADEPTGSLDADTGAEVIGLFEELNRQEGITLVVVTHEERVARAAQRVVRLRDGLVEAPEPVVAEGGAR